MSDATLLPWIGFHSTCTHQHRNELHQKPSNVRSDSCTASPSSVSRPHQKITRVGELEKCLFAVRLCVRERRRGGKTPGETRERRTSNIQFNTAAAAFINANTLSKCVRVCVSVCVCAWLEADAALISVAAVEPLAAQITAGGCRRWKEGRAQRGTLCKQTHTSARTRTTMEDESA